MNPDVQKRIARNARPAAATQRGMTMVESLVALVVLSVGLLGIASLYVSTLRAERSAQLRTQAVALVTDMTDRIRANAPARDAYDMSKYAGKPAGQNCVGTVTNCTSAQLAQDDLKRWLDAVKGTLPNVTVTDVKVDLAAATGRPDNYQVRIVWREAGETVDFHYQNNLAMISVTP
jgi:type IV pilus assembly protein PilV